MLKAIWVSKQDARIINDALATYEKRTSEFLAADAMYEIRELANRIERSTRIWD